MESRDFKHAIAPANGRYGPYGGRERTAGFVSQSLARRKRPANSTDVLGVFKATLKGLQLRHFPPRRDIFMFQRFIYLQPDLLPLPSGISHIIVVVVLCFKPCSALLKAVLGCDVRCLPTLIESGLAKSLAWSGAGRLSL